MGNLNHLALIMDGNGRWAKKKGLIRTKGHEQGSVAAEKVAAACIKHGIRFLTLYCFSTENWSRPMEEVNFLMGLLAEQIVAKIPAFNNYGMRILHLGNREGMPQECLEKLDYAAEATKNNTKLTVQLAINYGGRDEITRAINRALKDGTKEFKDDTLLSYVDHPEIPEPDMICRSAGEKRLSGFLLLQSNYAEFGFYDELWPDWDEKMVDRIVADFESRTRKYGGLVN